MDSAAINNTTHPNLSGHNTNKYWFHTTNVVLSVVTILGSTLVIFLIATRPRLQNQPNMFVLSLMVADFLIGVFIRPLETACSFNFQTWCNNKFLLRVFFNFLLSASITNLVSMTVERYIYVVLPLHYHTYMTPKRAMIAITSSWAVAMLVHVIPVWSYIDSLNISLSIRQGYLLFRICLFAIAPCIMLALAFANILVITRKIARQVAAQKAQVDFNSRSDRRNSPSLAQENVCRISERATSRELSRVRDSIRANPDLPSRRKSKSNLTRLQRTVKLIGVVIFLHEFCWSMTVYVSLCYDFKVAVVCKSLFRSHWVAYLSMMLLHVNSAANPIVYALMKKDIREELGKLLKLRI